MSYDNGSPPDDIADAAGEGLTEIGAAQNANGGGTSAVATALPLAATARVLLASPSTTVERRGSDFSLSLGRRLRTAWQQRSQWRCIL